MKRCLLICQSNDGGYINLLHEALQRNDCELTVFTGNPAGICDAVTVVPSVKYNSVSLTSRFKTWFAFVREAKRYLKANASQFDMVMFTSNPPINQGLVRYVQRRGIPTVYLVWDIYPEFIETSFGNVVKPITAVWRRRNRRIYNAAAAVLTIGDVMSQRLAQSYPEARLRVIPYHTDTAFIHPIEPEDNLFLREHPQLCDKKIFMYSGKMGLGHGFEELLEAAKRLRDRDDVMFLFVGHGTAYADIERCITAEGLSNAMILPYQPWEMLPHSLGCADVAFISMKSQNDGLFLPSKVYDAMASGSAILCVSGGNNDVAHLVTEHGVGLSVDVGDVDALTAAVCRFADDEALLRDCQARARELAVSDYEVQRVAESYAALFREVLEETIV